MSDSQPAAESEEWNMDYSKPSSKSFTGQRVSASSSDVLQSILDESKDPNNRKMDLICFSTFHQHQAVFKDSKKSQKMLGYAGVVDLDVKKPPKVESRQFVDCDPRIYDINTLKSGIAERVESGLTLRELADCCPSFGQTLKAAELLVNHLADFNAHCWFTGGKGFRVVFFDPKAFYLYCKSDRISDWVMAELLPKVVGADIMNKVHELCEWDKNIYDGGKGVKTDLQMHPKTGFWPFYISDDVYDKPMKRDTRDKHLCTYIIPTFWRSVLMSLPKADEMAGISRFAASPSPGRVLKRSAQAQHGNSVKRSRQEPGEAVDDQPQRRSTQQAVLAMLVRIHPSHGDSYEPWTQVFFALFNEIGDAAFIVFDEWSRSASSYKGMEDITTTFRNVQSRTGQAFSIRSLASWAFEAPALQWKTLATLDTVAGSVLDHAESFLASVDLLHTGWKLMIRIGSLLFRDSKKVFMDHLEPFFPSVERASMSELWGLKQECDHEYVRALREYIETEWQGFSMVLRRTLEPTYGRVQVAGPYKPGSGRLTFWKPADVGNPGAALSLVLETGAVTNSSGTHLQNLYPLRAIFTDDFRPVNDIELAHQLATALKDHSLLKYDTSSAQWRFFHKKTHLWHKCGQMVDDMDFTDAVSILMQESRSLVEPMLHALEALSRLESNKTVALNKVCGRLQYFLMHRIGGHPQLNNLLKVLSTARGFQSDFSAPPPHLVVTPSGVVDLCRGELDMSGFHRDYNLTEELWICTPFKKFSDAELATITDFFLQYMFPADVYKEGAEIVGALQKFMGYRLTGDTSLQQAWFLYGKGGNMKTMLSKWLFETLGEQFVASLTASDLGVKHSANNDALYSSRKKRVWNINESNSNNKWDEEVFKALTGDESDRGVSAKYKSEVRFKPVAKMMAFVNALPAIETTDPYPIDRRCVSVLLKLCYAVSEQQRSMLISDGVPEAQIRAGDPHFYQNEMEQRKELFLAWMVEGARRYYDERSIRVPQSLQGHSFSGNSKIADLVHEFVGSSLKHMAAHRIPFEWLYEGFLTHNQLDVSREEISFRHFNKICWKECSARFSQAVRNLKCRVTESDGTSGLKPCIMNVFWKEGARKLMPENFQSVRENTTLGAPSESLNFDRVE